MQQYFKNYRLVRVLCCLLNKKAEVGSYVVCAAYLLSVIICFTNFGSMSLVVKFVQSFCCFHLVECLSNLAFYFNLLYCTKPCEKLSVGWVRSHENVFGFHLQICRNGANTILTSRIETRHHFRGSNNFTKTYR